LSASMASHSTCRGVSMTGIRFRVVSRWTGGCPRGHERRRLTHIPLLLRIIYQTRATYPDKVAWGAAGEEESTKDALSVLLSYHSQQPRAH
jgi:hypothetical protein